MEKAKKSSHNGKLNLNVTLEHKCSTNTTRTQLTS